ncbi:MAG: tRNA (adenosine(37)-N6)-threonylcarbamoyltransferase complex ATPase subunit type 1 TsaE [Alteromonadaceae bacterium]|nr:MAG: tRNA (adenosine(37)-N6)-threonylcarbamoyltransferase complex ATPase subunit type 1 TsaE [Alteromonadaceae bacterium]
MHTEFLVDEQATVDCGKRLGKQLLTGGVVYLLGDLGTGKTTLSRGILNACGYDGAVKSPTYTLVEPYELDELQLFHFDLYRLLDPEELEYMGVRDYFQPSHLCLVEWPCRGLGVIPQADVIVELTVADHGRTIHLSHESTRGEQLLTDFAP